MRIELLPAFNGDCILAEYIPLHFILIDGGYVDTYHNHFSTVLQKKSGTRRHGENILRYVKAYVPDSYV